jgi:integrase
VPNRRRYAPTYAQTAQTNAPTRLSRGRPRPSLPQEALAGGEGQRQVKPKRRRGDGGLTRLPSGRYQVRLWIDGRRVARYAESEQEALRLLRGLQRSKDEGTPVPRERQSLGQFLKDWLESIEGSVRPTTFRRYEQYVRLWVEPELGKVALAKVSPQDVQRLYTLWLKRGKSPTSVHHLHTVLHRALGQAHRWGLASRNVADLVDPPRIARKEMASLSQEEVVRLLQAAADDRLEALYVLAVTTGMRQGELLGLRWEDVDLKRQILRVRGSLQKMRDGFKIVETKTAKSRRSVLLSPHAVEALRRHKTRQAAERLKLGKIWADQGLVFPNEIGGPLDAANLTNRSFKRLLRRANLPRIRFHDLRHTAATLLMQGNVHPKLVQEILDHSTIATTLDLYSHVAPAMHEEAARVMDGVLRVAREQVGGTSD